VECRRRFDDRAGQEAGLHLSDPIDQIPEDRREKARSALAATFGRSPVTVLQPLTAGASALSYHIEVAGRPYLLRLESFRRDEVRDPHRAYLCLRAAAEAGVAPAVHHADPAAAVAIMDFVPERPLSDYPGGAPPLVRDLGSLVNRLQATPAFPPVFDYPALIGILLGRLIGSGLFAAGLLESHRDGFERIREAYPWDSGTLVSSHNDLNPGNILFDGKRLWLVDWETAYRNDPLLDVATLSLFFAGAPDLESALLRSWLGREPDHMLRARFSLMRQLARLFYGCAASLNAANTPVAAEPATDLKAPTHEQFRDALAQGRPIAGAPETQRIIGKMALAGFLAGLATPEFEEALGMVRQQG
jgi:aminoglycoside phosphotransferase (APT) family kinase protein